MFSQQYIWILLAAASFLGSVLLKVRERDHWALLALTLSGFFVYMYAIHLCPALNLWDEQYHAVVALNCMQHPFHPAFYTEEVVPGHDYLLWTQAGIWLHKQPLFLWQIALSFRIFGVSDLSLRIPSVIQCTLLIPLLYRMVILLLKDRHVAYFAALSVAASFHLIRLTAGMESTDHNDVCFVFYVAASLWALLEYLRADRRKGAWALAMGLLAGAAVLTKWLVGLTVYLFWGLYLLFEHRVRLRQWHLPHLPLALACTVAVALPWQIYILQQFPVPARHELFYNLLHTTNVLEEHQQHPLYYLQILAHQYFGHHYDSLDSHFQGNLGTLISYLCLAIGIVIFFKRLEKKSHRLAIGSAMLFIYLFFSCSKTKMPSFTFILCPVWFTAIACLADLITQKIKSLIHQPILQSALLFVAIAIIGYYQTNYPHYIHEKRTGYYATCAHNKAIYQSWRQQVPEGHTIFNVNGFNGTLESYNYLLAPSAYFYSGHPCYTELPDYATLKALQQKGLNIAVVDMPGYIDAAILNDTTFIHLPNNMVSF